MMDEIIEEILKEAYKVAFHNRPLRWSDISDKDKEDLK